MSTLADYLAVAVDAARLGAAELERWRKQFKVKEKSRADLVTDADHASQKAVRDHLMTKLPHHAFLGEEECVGKKIDETRPPANSPPLWIVDPLDGTINYVHDVPAYCVSIGLWVNGEAVVGVILDPRQNELFTATKGGGAHLNGEPIHVSDTAVLENALVSTGFPANKDAQRRNLKVWADLSPVTRSLRRTGSTALNMAYVACGRFDGYWAYDNWPWDVTGGACLIAEAGGVLSNAEGGPFDPFRMDLIATNGTIQRELFDALTAAEAK
jgi:myo-inositol-1(or 4)-monophosphatase